MLFSIIIPIYNVEPYLKDCIESVLSQTYEKFEMILVDDGSTDDSGRICEEYASIDPRIVVVHKENGGLSDARNAGIPISNGEYLFFLDSDDYWIDNDFLHKMSILIKQNNYPSIVIGDSYFNVFPRGKTIQIKCNFQLTELNNLGGEDALEYILSKTKYNAWSAWRNVYRSELIKSHKLYFKKGILCEDAEWTPRVVLHAKKIALYEEPFYMYRISRPNSIMNTCSIKKLRDYLQVVINWFEYANQMENQKLSSIIKSKFANDYIEYFRYYYFFEREARDELIVKITNSGLLRYVSSSTGIEIKQRIERDGFDKVLKELNVKYRRREKLKNIAVKLRLIDR